MRERADKQGFVRTSFIKCGDGRIISLTKQERRDLLAAAPFDVDFSTEAGWNRELRYLAIETDILAAVALRLEQGAFDLNASE